MAKGLSQTALADGASLFAVAPTLPERPSLQSYSDSKLENRPIEQAFEDDSFT
jgi:hypothetical protein